MPPDRAFRVVRATRAMGRIESLQWTPLPARRRRGRSPRGSRRKGQPLRFDPVSFPRWDDPSGYTFLARVGSLASCMFSSFSITPPTRIRRCFLIYHVDAEPIPHLPCSFPMGPLRRARMDADPQPSTEPSSKVKPSCISVKLEKRGKGLRRLRLGQILSIHRRRSGFRSSNRGRHHRGGWAAIPIPPEPQQKARDMAVEELTRHLRGCPAMTPLLQALKDPHDQHEPRPAVTGLFEKAHCPATADGFDRPR